MLVDRVDGANIGAVLVTDDASLLIEEIIEGQGLLYAWNQANPDLQIHQRDSLVEVNGIFGDSDAMLEELSKHRKHVVKVLRERVDLKTRMSEHVKTMGQITSVLSNELWRKTKSGLLNLSNEQITCNEAEQYMPQRYNFNG